MDNELEKKEQSDPGQGNLSGKNVKGTSILGIMMI